MCIRDRNNINLTATADVNIPSGVGLTFATAEKIESDGTDLSITVGSNGDINIPANIGLTFGDDGEKIEGDGTNLQINSSSAIAVAGGSWKFTLKSLQNRKRCGGAFGDRR